MFRTHGGARRDGGGEPARPNLIDKAPPFSPVMRITDEGQARARGVLERWQHAGEDFESQILFVAQAVGAALDDSDLVVEPLDEAERDFVFEPAVGGDAVPMTIDHRGKLLIGLEPLAPGRTARTLAIACLGSIPSS